MKNLLYILLFVPLALFGQDNYSLSFDGVDDYISLMYASELSFGDDNFSFMSSFKANEKKRQWLISNYQSPTNNDILFAVGTDVYDDELLIIYDIRSPGFSYTGVGSTDLFDGEFHTVSFVRNQDNFIVYIDGLVEIDTFHTINSLTDASPFKIGYEHESYSDSYWSGYISETVFWDTSLSEQDVYSYSQCSYLITDSEPIAYWDFNEGEEETILYDLGAAQINGTIHGATYSEDVPENNCVEGCTEGSAFNYNPEANVNDDSCYPVIYGCLDVNAYNFDQTANTDDGSCEYSGCMNSDAINFDEIVTIDDEQSCIYSQDYVHGLWNEVDDGIIENEYLQEEYNGYQEQATTSLSSLQQALDTWNTTIDLSAGWNMFGYGCPSPIDVIEGLSNHTESILITKDNNGAVYMPEWGFNGIGDFTPGFGYQIKVTEAIEGFSLCDWYVNDIPEDNIVSLQEEIEELQEEVDFMSPYFGCIDESACNYDITASLDDGGCEYPNEGLLCNGDSVPYIGMLAEGGMVFYVDSTGQHGLVAPLEDLGSYQWGCFGEYANGADGTSIGTGYQNTMDIVNQGCSTVIGGITAAQAALDAEINGYSDWYLPSKDELREMYNSIGNGGPEGNIGGFSSGSKYWSSSEKDNLYAWWVLFANGLPDYYDKYGSHRVRPIRSF
jgi:hypothetical protein